MTLIETISQHPVRISGDIVAGSTIVASFIGWLPPLAALAALVWTCLQIYWGIQDRRRKDKK